ncbi:MAG TPA: AbrB/MazE/SpoVT family DNA-binding domain-containing protein [Solirubrobacteraceae bacterium]|nr:AbrB/MazE/SpoVT family DNA-binding domain-containing protein [Solirubrobacteraceae bacterium]
MRSTISEKGQITVPKSLRDRLGIRGGDRLEFTEGHGGLVMRKATDQVLRALRGDPDAV